MAEPAKSDSLTADELFAEYERYVGDLHKIVKAQIGARDQEPGSLRVGVNIAMSDHSALAKLLIDKGLISIEEYSAALLAMMKEEVKNAAKRLGAR